MERRQDTKQALLRAAEELFADHGYEAVGTRDIARRANTNVSSIKYHFGSKRQLYIETIRELLRDTDIKSAWEGFREPPDDPAEAARLIAVYVRGAFTEAERGGRSDRCVRLMLQEALHPGEDADFIVENFSAPYERLMVSLVKAIAPGRSETFYTTSGRSIFALVLHHFIWRSFLARSEFGVLGESLPTVAAADEVTRLFLRGLGCDESTIDQALANEAPTTD